jgi:acylphosphatase
MAERTVRWIIRGRVQGVAFRYFTRQTAQPLRLQGWVRNLSDGSVEVRVRGQDDELDTFREQLRKGPPMGRVEEIVEEDLPDSEALAEGLFEIRL